MYQCIAVKKGNISLFNCVFYVKNVKSYAVKTKYYKYYAVKTWKKIRSNKGKEYKILQILRS